MPVDREKLAETMLPCDSYEGWAAKYLRGDHDFRELFNEVKGLSEAIVPGADQSDFALNPGPEKAVEEVPDEVVPVVEGDEARQFTDEEVDQFHDGLIALNILIGGQVQARALLENIYTEFHLPHG